MVEIYLFKSHDHYMVGYGKKPKGAMYGYNNSLLKYNRFIRRLKLSDFKDQEFPNDSEIQHISSACIISANSMILSTTRINLLDKVKCYGYIIDKKKQTTSHAILVNGTNNDSAAAAHNIVVTDKYIVVSLSDNSIYVSKKNKVNRRREWTDGHTI